MLHNAGGALVKCHFLKASAKELSRCSVSIYSHIWDDNFSEKMGDDGAEGNAEVLASLFTVTTKKAAPQYDYSVVPSRYRLFCFLCN